MKISIQLNINVWKKFSQWMTWPSYSCPKYIILLPTESMITRFHNIQDFLLIAGFEFSVNIPKSGYYRCDSSGKWQPGNDIPECVEKADAVGEPHISSSIKLRNITLIRRAICSPIDCDHRDYSLRCYYQNLTLSHSLRLVNTWA